MHVLASMLSLFSLLAMRVSSSGRSKGEHAISAFGCTVFPQVPTIADGKIKTPVRVKCVTSMADRELVTELQQQRGDGTYASILSSRLIAEVTEPVMEDDFMMDNTVFGWPVQCRSVSGVRTFRSSVTIGADTGAPERVLSSPVELPQDCIGGGQDELISEEARQLAATCDAAPMTDAEAGAILERQQSSDAAPETMSSLDPFDATHAKGFVHESELPACTEADPDSVLEIQKVEQAFANCYNAGELRRAATLLTHRAQREFVALAAGEEFPVNRFEHAFPMPIDLRISSIGVRGARLFPDGRMGAIVDWPQKSTFHVYTSVDGIWRVSDWVTLSGET